MRVARLVLFPRDGEEIYPSVMKRPLCWSSEQSFRLIEYLVLGLGLGSDWHGEPFGGIAAADFNFPCVSAACASKWHGKGTPCRPFRDLAYRGRNCAWQRMCSECHECGSPLWSPAATQPAPAPAVDPLSPGAIEMWETMSDDD